MTLLVQSDGLDEPGSLSPPALRLVFCTIKTNKRTLLPCPGWNI